MWGFTPGCTTRRLLSLGLAILVLIRKGHFLTRALHHVVLQITRLCEGFAALVTTVWLLTSALLSGVHQLVFIKISRVYEGITTLATTVVLMTSVSHMWLFRQKGCVKDV